MRLGLIGLTHQRVVAFGQTQIKPGQLDSFLLTDAEEGYRSAADWLCESTSRGRPLLGCKPREIGSFLSEMATTVRRFHCFGYSHQKLTLDALQVKQSADGTYCVRIGDTARVLTPDQTRPRGQLKDLCWLISGFPQELLTCSRLVAFLKHYRDVLSFGPRRQEVGPRGVVRRAVRVNHDRIETVSSLLIYQPAANSQWM